MKRVDSLVIYRKQLGDVLLLQPALQVLAGRGRVSLSTRPGFADLIGLMPGPVEVAPRFLPSADEVYCLEAKPAALLYAALAFGAKRQLILTRDEGPAWSKWIFQARHVVPGGDSYRAALFHKMVGGDMKCFVPPVLNSPPAAWQPAGLPSRYGVIHPTSAWQRKAWSPRNWVKALAGIDAGFPWVISSGSSPWEIELATQVAQGLGDRGINLAGKTDLRQYLGLLAGSTITLCVDGSASHLSAAFGHPTLTLFGPTNPAHWHWPTATTPRLWARDYSSEEKPSADAIPVEAVRVAIIDLVGALDG